MIALARTSDGDGSSMTITDERGVMLAHAELSDAGAARLAALLASSVQRALRGRTVRVTLTTAGGE